MRPFAVGRGYGADGCVRRDRTAAGRPVVPIGHVWSVHAYNVVLA